MLEKTSFLIKTDELTCVIAALLGLNFPGFTALTVAVAAERAAMFVLKLP